MYELVTFEITDWNEWFSTQLASWWLTNWLTDRMWPDNQNYKTLTGLIKNGVEEGRGRLPLPNVMVFAREAIKKGRRFQKKSVSRLWTKGSDPPPLSYFRWNVHRFETQKKCFKPMDRPRHFELCRKKNINKPETTTKTWKYSRVI